MPTPIVDLTRVSILAEIVLRAGNAQSSNARHDLQRAYTGFDAQYPDTIGLSVLFREGASLDELAREGAFPHAKLSFTIIGRIVNALAAVGYNLVLYITPDSILPDHHSLAVAQHGIVQATLPDDAADALIHSLNVVDNPYRARHP